jgi:hypothetical protein
LTQNLSIPDSLITQACVQKRQQDRKGREIRSQVAPAGTALPEESQGTIAKRFGFGRRHLRLLRIDAA